MPLGRARSGFIAPALALRTRLSCGPPSPREHRARIEAFLERPRDTQWNAWRTPGSAHVAFVVRTRALQYGDAARRLERSADRAERGAIDRAQEIGGRARWIDHRCIPGELNVRSAARGPRKTGPPLRL